MHPFPATRHSLLAALAAGEDEARRRGADALVAAYWKPSCTYLRLRWRASAEDAQDLVQGFFARALEKSFFAGFDPGRARFRTFLRTCLDGYVANVRAEARRLKRGGGAAMVSLDEDAGVAGALAADTEGPDELFHREWVREVVAAAVSSLRERCLARGRASDFEAFTRYDLVEADEDRPTYAEVAVSLGLAPTQVTNALHRARRDFRAALITALRERTATPDEFESEARALLGEAWKGR